MLAIMDHLVCFLPGILALGAYSKPDSPNRDRDMMLAKSLMYTCYQMYKRTKTGIAAEYYEMPGGGDPQPAKHFERLGLGYHYEDSLRVLRFHLIEYTFDRLLLLGMFEDLNMDDR